LQLQTRNCTDAPLTMAPPASPTFLKPIGAMGRDNRAPPWQSKA
jgi:hypothetical protein